MTLAHDRATDPMSDQPSNFTGDVPKNYDHGLGPVFFTDFAEMMAHRVSNLGVRRVLETSAGTGIVTRWLRDLLPPEAQLLATDLNPPMLEVARGKFRPGEGVAFQPADATELTFPDGAFDAVVCQFGIMFFPDKPKSYREAFRVLMPGGHFLFSVWDAHRYNLAPRRTHEFLAELFPEDPPRFYETPFAYCAIDPIKQAMTEAGFINFQAAVHRIDKPVADPSAFVRGLIFGNPVIEQIRGRGGDPAEVMEQLREALRREFGPEPYRIPMQVIFFEATRP